MIKKHINIVAILLCFWSYSAYSQINCTNPLPPVLTSVSVQPETGYSELNWRLSPSPDIAAYILYTYKDGVGMPFDTLWDPFATNYTLTNTAAKNYSVSYVIAAHRRPNCSSPLSNALNTIYCSSEIDTCKNEILLKWNSYPDYPKSVLEYKVSVSINENPLSEKYRVDNKTNSLSITDFATDSKYCFLVSAVLEEGMTSFSNKSNYLFTRMQRPPRWINADYATVNDENEISLSFTIDPLSEISLFRLERKTGLSGSFHEIVQLESTDGSILFTDSNADTDSINSYRISAINNCNIPVTVSNISTNMVLTFERTGDNLNFSWNPYKDWLGIVSSYRLFINTGKGFEEKEIMQPTDTILKFGYREIMYEVSGNEICFYISASEKSNPYGINGQSASSRICTFPTEIITIPNIFTPNNDLVNDIFRPVLSFTPQDFHLIISDRKGNILFETKDYNAGWDGYQNGNPQPQGVYLWFIKLTMPSGKSVTKTGTLTIINNW
jgi:gliding motility-associated-like protein